MSEIYYAALTLSNADEKRGDPGRIANVYYKIEGDKVVIYNAKGVPFVDADGRRYEQDIGEADAPEAVALRLARAINRKLSDGDAAFNAPIKYQKSIFV